MGTPASQYLAAREGGGWLTQNITTPLLSGSYGDDPQGVPYQLFSGDLARGLLLNGQRCEDESPCPRSYSLRDSASGALTPSVQTSDLRFSGASPDLSHVVLSSCSALTDDAIEVPGEGGCDPLEPNLYEWGGGGLTLLNLLPGEAEGAPGAALAAQAGAVSSDGSRVYWTEGGNLYLRDGDQTKQVDEALGGGGTLQAASAAGGVAFFTKLEPSKHLFRYVAASEEVTDVTPDGGVVGVLGASADGSRSTTKTPTASSSGRKAPRLWLPKGPARAPGDFPPPSAPRGSAPTGSISPSSPRPRWANTTTPASRRSTLYWPSAVGGGPRADLRLLQSDRRTPARRGFDSRAVANGTGGAATDAYKPRVLSADGSRVFFDSSDHLAIQDTNDGNPDVYEWEAAGAGTCQRLPGCVSLISSGRSPEPSPSSTPPPTAPMSSS